MKTYEKPVLNALSLSGNDLLCNSCDIDIIGENADPVYKEIMEMFGGNAFTSDSDCTFEVEGYCKFSGANVVINS